VTWLCHPSCRPKRPQRNGEGRLGRQECSQEGWSPLAVKVVPFLAETHTDETLRLDVFQIDISEPIRPVRNQPVAANGHRLDGGVRPTRRDRDSRCGRGRLRGRACGYPESGSGVARGWRSRAGS
jgi:hypothetical protein